LPLSTFHNLDTERQQEIIDTALREFASHNYKTASFNRIARKLGIAKGSFYRYFESKKKLYYFLIDYSSQKELEIMSEIAIKTDKSFCDMFDDMYEAGLKFYEKQPLVNLFLLQMWGDNSSVEEIGNQQKIYLQKSEGFLIPLIINAQKKGELRGDISPEYISFIIIQNLTGFIEYVKYKYDKDLALSLKTGDWKIAQHLDELREFTKSQTKVLQRGLIKI